MTNNNESYLIDEILTEWSYRVNNGMPDVNNKLHLIDLQELLYEKKYSKKFIEMLLNNLQENDIVKNKESGNIYVVQTHNPDTQNLVKKDASDTDIEKINNSEAETTEDIVDIQDINFERNKYSFEVVVNGTKIRLITSPSKKTPEFKQRMVKLLQNPIFKKNVKVFKELTESLDELPINHIRLKAVIKKLKDVGVELTINNYSAGKGKQVTQIRIGSVPFYTFGNGTKKIDDVDDFREQNGFSLQKGTKGDTVLYKTQTFFSPEEASNVLENNKNVPDNFKNQPYNDLGTGYKDVSNYVVKSINRALEQQKEYTKEERIGLKQYSKCIQTKQHNNQFLKNCFKKLIESSINRGNEVWKNFGEIHAALDLSLQHPTSQVLFPSSGQAPVGDLILVHKDKTHKTNLVEMVSVKSKKKGAPSSVVETTRIFIYKKDRKSKEASKKWLFISEYFRKGSGSKFRKLEDENSEETKKVKGTLLNYFDNEKVLNELNSENAQKYYMKLSEFEDFNFDNFSKDLKMLSTQQLIILASRFNKVTEAIFDEHVKEHIDCEKTSESLTTVEVDNTGEIESIPFSCDGIYFAPPKRVGEIATMGINKR